MKKITYGEMVQKFNENPSLRGVIVYSQENWKKKYSELSRSYQVNGDSWGFQNDKIGHCIIGYCLDKTSPDSEGVRLDHYNWKVEYCYILD